MKIKILLCFLFSLNIAIFAEDVTVQKLSEFSSVFRDIAKKVSPSVVSIEVSKTIEYLEDPYGLNRFFNIETNRGKRIKKKVEVSSGSGFIADEEGHILTNFHVIEEGQEVSVTLLDGRKINATFIGGDNELDIAVLKINLARIEPCVFGDSSKVEVGDWVLAIGNPYGFSHTVTEGIISAKYRENNSLQTSAAINPGNSGGPLLDLDGKVIGINRSIKTTTGANIGIGFAIPVNIVKQALNDIVKYKKIKYGTIGVTLVDQNNKCVVEKVFLESPAKKGKILQGDVVLEFNSIKVNSASQFNALLAEKRKGETINLKMLRGTNEMDLPIPIIEKEEWEKEKSTEFLKKLDIKFVALDEAKRMQFGVLVNFGLYVGESKNKKLSLKEGDVILAINGIRMESIASFVKAASEVETKKNTLTILRKRSYWDETFELE